LLLAAAAWIAITAVHEIRNPHEAPAPFTLAVLVLVIIIKEALFRFVAQESSSLDSTVVRTDAWHHRSDAITSLAAGIGISVALIGGKGYEAADDYAAAAAAAVIAWNGWQLLRQALMELMDTAPSRDIVERIRGVAESGAGVDRVEKCIVRKMGYLYYVDMHVHVRSVYDGSSLSRDCSRG
jgi:cation diffusion facilitator family transporter